MQLASFKRVAPRLNHPTRLTALALAASLMLGYAPFAHAAPGEEKIYYYLHDHLGGNVVCRNDYLPYGNGISDPNKIRTGAIIRVGTADGWQPSVILLIGNT